MLAVCCELSSGVRWTFRLPKTRLNLSAVAISFAFVVAEPSTVDTHHEKLNGKRVYFSPEIRVLHTQSAVMHSLICSVVRSPPLYKYIFQSFHFISTLTIPTFLSRCLRLFFFFDPIFVVHFQMKDFHSYVNGIPFHSSFFFYLFPLWRFPLLL